MVDRKWEAVLDFHRSGSAEAHRVWCTHKRSPMRWLAVFALTGSLACSTTLAPAPSRTEPSAYRIGAPDRLTIRIQPDPEMVLDVTVRPDGMISVPLIGDVTASGRTIPQIADDIEARMTQFKRGAEATVMLVAAVHNEVTVLGEVVRPASFALVKDTRVVEVIARAGGPTTFAWRGRIRVIRNVDGTTEVHRVDLADIRNGDQTTNLFLLPGDIIYVPPSILARIGYAINAVFFPFQPLIGLARIAPFP